MEPASIATLMLLAAFVVPPVANRVIEQRAKNKQSTMDKYSKLTLSELIYSVKVPEYRVNLIRIKNRLKRTRAQLESAMHDHKHLNSYNTDVEEGIKQIDEYRSLLRDNILIYLIEDVDSINETLSYINKGLDKIVSNVSDILHEHSMLIKNITAQTADVRIKVDRISMRCAHMIPIIPVANDIKDITKGLYGSYVESIKDEDIQAREEIKNQLNTIDKFTETEYKRPFANANIKDWIDLIENFT